VDEEIKQNVDTGSVAFKSGIEAGLNSIEDTKNWRAGNKLGQELKEDVEEIEPVAASPTSETSIPLFLRDDFESKEPNAQDEKDATEE
jgi:hypothetical protein